MLKVSFFIMSHVRCTKKKKKTKQKKMLIKFKRTKQKSLEGMSITCGSQTPQNKENILSLKTLKSKL